MKKILLATTFLVATTGFAAAEISFGGSAKAGIAKDAGFDENGDGDFLDADDVAPTDYETYSSAELAVTMSGDTDNGLTFGADFSVTVGRSYDLADDDGFGDEGGFDPMPKIWVDGAYGKITIADDDFDFFDDTNGGGDIKYEGTFGAFSVGLITDVDASEFSASVGYTNGNLSVSANVDTYELANVEASYTFNVITATIATDEDSNSSVKIAYASGPISASAKYNTSDESVDVALGFANNGISLDAEYNTVSENYTVTAGYDLGGGLSLEAGTNYTGDVMIGAAMSF